MLHELEWCHQMVQTSYISYFLCFFLMFRKSNSNSNSSLSSGNASIVEQKHERANNNSDTEEDDEKSIDITIESMSAVIAAAVQLSSSNGKPSSLSSGSASILQPFSKQDKRRNSRFSLFTWKKQEKKEKDNTTPTLDSGLSLNQSSDDDSCSSPSSPRSSSASSPKAVMIDDGKDELMYRGIQIKEIKTTLKTLVISDEVRHPMPQVKLERPGFARINY
ncbi:hypothetical protein RMATCC62417_18720 [Rhizopus microsporus]|nr:hypothetical protein RMATCC62417_18720 [Rhizopus microsporus]